MNRSKLLMEALPDYAFRVENPDNLSPEEVAVFTTVSRDRSGVGFSDKVLQSSLKKDFKHIKILVDKKYLIEEHTMQGTFIKMNDSNSNAFRLFIDLGKLPSEILLLHSRVKKFLKKNMNRSDK